MASVPEILRGPFDLCGDHAEAWKPAHADAMGCGDVERAVRFGLFIIDDLQLQNARWAEDVRHGAEPFSWEMAERFAAGYQWWLERGRLVLDAIAECERAESDVEGAARFREKYREISLLPLDISKVRRSIESLEQGRGISRAQAMYALRNPVR
jgi:hypothetical protein